jgi:hypothetical protein
VKIGKLFIPQRTKPIPSYEHTCIGKRLRQTDSNSCARMTIDQYQVGGCQQCKSSLEPPSDLHPLSDWSISTGVMPEETQAAATWTGFFL